MAYEFDDMLASLPRAYRADRWVQAYTGAVTDKDQQQREIAAATGRQMFLDTMTWLLEEEERLAAIVPQAGDTLADRRGALGAKWRAGAGKCDIERIRAVCGSWDGVAAQVSYDGLCVITVLFRSWGEMPGNMGNVRRALREIVPAHLRFEVIAQLVREATAHCCTVVTMTRHKAYDAVEVGQWGRVAAADERLLVTMTRHRAYPDVSTGAVFTRETTAHPAAAPVYSKQKGYQDIEVM